jgi:hypothetical protein
VARRDRQPVLLDVRGLPADLATVNSIARLQLSACRRGYRLQLVGASPELERLIGFAGLSETVPLQGRG